MCVCATVAALSASATSVCSCALPRPSTGPVPSPRLRRGRPQGYPDSTSAPRRGYNGPNRVAAQSRCLAAPPPAVQALHVRSCKGPGLTGLTTLRSRQFTSTTGRRRLHRNPLSLSLTGGRVGYSLGSRGYLRGSQSVQRRLRLADTERPVARPICGDIFFPPDSAVRSRLIRCPRRIRPAELGPP